MRIYHLLEQGKCHFTVVNMTHLSPDVHMLSVAFHNIWAQWVRIQPMIIQFTMVKWARVNIFLDLPRLPIYCGTYFTTVNLSRANTALDALNVWLLFSLRHLTLLQLSTQGNPCPGYIIFSRWHNFAVTPGNFSLKLASLGCENTL